MHPRDCPEWEYSNHPHRARVLPRRCKEQLAALRRGRLDTLAVSRDSRLVHRHLFSELAPRECPYYAGHYRGEPFRCLEYNRVRIANDPRVGEQPGNVVRTMDVLAQIMDQGVAAIDTANQLPNAQVPRRQKVYYLIAFACRVFVEFLRIHPYANGNGHAGRFIIWALLGRYELWPRSWPVDTRPPDPPYSPANFRLSKWKT